jgi:hypothetical protein
MTKTYSAFAVSHARPGMIIFNRSVLLASVLSLVVIPLRLNAAEIYAASGQGGAGELYILDSATGAIITDIGPLNDSTARNFGITGLAFSPVSGVLYGSSANGNSDPSTRDQLVTINSATGRVTTVGNFWLAAGGTMTDIAFDPITHLLYGITSNGGPNLYTIDPSTAHATLIGSSGLNVTNGGGLAVSSSRVVYGTPLPASFGTYDETTGAFTNIANPTKPNGRGYGALAFNGNVLYGLEVGTASHLVTFDTTTGTVTDHGATGAQFLDAIAFRVAVPEPTSLALSITPLLALLFGRRREVCRERMPCSLGRAKNRASRPRCRRYGHRSHTIIPSTTAMSVVAIRSVRRLNWRGSQGSIANIAAGNAKHQFGSMSECQLVLEVDVENRCGSSNEARMASLLRGD